MFCGGCGSDVPAGSKFCQKCGRPTATAGAPAPQAAPPAPPVQYAPPPPSQAAPAPTAYAPPAYMPPPQTMYAGPTQVAAPVHYGGFWIRFLAYLLDGVILGIPIGIIFVIVIFALGGMAYFEHINPAVLNNPDPEAALSAGAPVLAAILGFYLIFGLGTLLITWLYFAGMESSARQATLGKAVLGMRVTDLNGNRVSFGRASGRFFSKIISGMIMYIGYIMAGFTEKKQALHDMIAGTLVMRR
jgi:uncharacterized RDD family membrane protein YckC